MPSTCTPSTIFGPGPALRTLQHDHRPARPGHFAAVRALRLIAAISSSTRSRVAAICWCIDCGLVARDEVRLPAVARQQALQLLARDARENGRIGDLVAIQVQDRQHRAVAWPG